MHAEQVVINPNYIEQKTIKLLNVFTMYKTWLPCEYYFLQAQASQNYASKYRSNVT